MRKDLLDKQVAMRHMYTEQRIARIRRAGGLFGPVLAERTSHPEGLGATRKSTSGLGKHEASEGLDNPAIAGLQPEAWLTIDRAVQLCVAMEEALIHNQIPVMVALVEESAEIGKSMAVLEGQMGRDSKTRSACAAFDVMTKHETMLLEAKRQLEQKKDREHIWGGIVRDYKFSPAHDSLVMRVTLDDESHVYPIDELDRTPEPETRVNIHRRESGIEIEDLGRPQRSQGRERV